MIPGSIISVFGPTSAVAQQGLILNVDAGNSNSYPGTGTTWSDLSSSGLNGVLDNGASYDSADGGSIDFDGNNDRVTFGSAGGTLINGLSQLTIEIWFNSDVIGNDRGLIAGNSNSTGDTGFSLRYDNSGAGGGGTQVIKTGFGKEGNNSDSTVLESSSFIQTSNTWTCIAVTCNVGTSIALYKNGALDTPTDVNLGGSTVNGCNRLYVGEGPDVVGSSNKYWNGNVSIFRIYNRLLTTGEISGNYNAVKQRYGL